MEVFRLTLIVTAFIDVAICHEVNGLMYSKRVRTRRSGHSKETLEQVSRSDESVSELNVHSWEHSYRPTIDDPVVNGEISLNDTNIQNVKSTTMQSEESSVGLLTQTVGGISVSLEETFVQTKKADLTSFENFNVQLGSEDLQLYPKKSGNDTQILTDIPSSLPQHLYNTTVRQTSQPQYSTLNNTVEGPIMKNVSSENIARSLNTQYLYNTSRSNVQRSDSNLSSVRTANNLSLQSSEITTPFTKSYDTLMFSPDPLSTLNHETEVLYIPEMNNSNNADLNHSSNLSINPSAQHSIPRTKNLTTPFPELNRNLSEVQKQVGQSVNDITSTVHPNISGIYSAPQTEKLLEGEPVLTLTPGKVHEVPSVNQNISSFESSRVSEKNIQTNTIHTSFHSETSTDSTTSIIPSPIFYSSAGAYINSKTSFNDFSVKTNSTEAEITSEFNTESHHGVSEDNTPQTTLVTVPAANSSTVSLPTPAPHSISPSFNTPMKIMETWNTNATTTESSAGNISSSAIITTVESTDVITNEIFNNAKPVESVIPNIISNTAPSVETVTSGTILNTVVSVEDVTSGTVSSNEISAENVSSREISSTEQSVENLTSSTVLYMMPSTENAISKTLSSAVAVVNVTSTAKYSISFSSTVQPLEAVTSNTIPSMVQSIDNVTSGTISNTVLSAEESNTIFSTVQSAKTLISNASSNPLPSVESVTKSTSSTTLSSVPSMEYILPTKDATQRDKFQANIVSGKDESFHTTEEETERSFNSLNDISNTTSLKIIHEKLFVKAEKLTETEKEHNPLTIVFKSDMEVAEWFLSWDTVFRKYISKALTGCMGIQEKWNKTILPEDICYMIPGPYADSGNFTICILVKGHSAEGSMYISGKFLQKCLEKTLLNLKQVLHIQIIDTFTGIPTLQQSRCRIKEISGNRIKITVAVIVVIAISISVIAGIIFTIRYRQSHEFFQPTAGLSYQLPRRNDGRHLATDEECTAMEGGNAHLQEVKEDKANGSTPSTSKAPVVVKLISKEEHEKWVVPYDDVIIQDEKSTDHEDTRL